MTHATMLALVVAVETLDIQPRWLPPGWYLLRLEVDDAVASRKAGHVTVIFEVGG